MSGSTSVRDRQPGESGVSADELAGRLPDSSARGIAATMTDLIRGGELAPGTALPTVRALAARLGVSPGTVADAWAVLRKHRMITTLGRRGTMVSGPPTVSHPVRFERVGDFGDHLTQDLTIAAPDPALLPPLEKALLAGARTPRLNDYSRTAITPALLEAVRGTWPFTTEAWLAVGGGFEGVHLLCQALLVPGDRVAVEEPTAVRLLDILDALEVRAVPVACDDEGPAPRSLKDALDARPAMFLLQPRAQTPCGWSMSAARAEALAAALEDAPNVTVVEDDGAGPLAARPAHSIGTRLPGRTVVVRSYSKAYGPDLRLAVLGGPRGVIEKARVLRTYGTGWTSRILQDALAHLLTDASSQAHVAEAAHRYALRRTRLAELLAARAVETRNEDGLSLWVPVADETSALVTLAARGATASPGSHFVTSSAHPPHLRVAVSRLSEDAASLESTADLIALAAHTDRAR